MPNAAATLHRKLSKIMEQVGYIPKKGKSDQGYMFATASDVADKVRDELAKAHISWLPVEVEQLSAEGARTPSGKQALMTLRVHWLVTDGDSGESVIIKSVATGADMTDKAAPKAMTNALKYSFLMAFAIPTGDDPEAGKQEPDEPAARAPRPTAAPATSLSDDDLGGALTHAQAINAAESIEDLKAYGAQVSQDLTLNEAQRAYLQGGYITRLKELKARPAAAA